ncbi:MAG: Rnase Y domain-containing protein, partial [Gemmatimonadota bacterium]
MTNLLITVISASVALVVGIFAGRWWHARRIRQRIGSAEDEASSLLEEARREAQNIRREAELEGKEEAYQLKIRWEEEAQERRTELTEMERRLGEREERLERKLAQLDERQERQEERREKLEQGTAELEKREREVAEREAEALEQLEELAGLTADEARDRLVSRIEDEAKADAAKHAREVLEDARRDVDPGLARAMVERYLAQRYALDPEAFRAAYAVLGAQRN